MRWAAGRVGLAARSKTITGAAGGEAVNRNTAGPFRIVLQNPFLTRMVAAFAAVNVAEWAYVTSLSVVAFRRSGTLAVGLVGLRLFLSAISSFVATALLPRRNPGRTLGVVTGVRAVLAAGSAAVVISRPSLVPLLVLLAVDAAVSASYRPAQSALVPRVSRNPRELVASAAGFSTVKTLSQAAGAVLGGTALSVTSPGAVFSAAAVMFLLASLLVLPFGEARAVSSVAGRSIGVTRLLRETATLVKIPHVGTILLMSGLRTFVRGMWVAIAVIASLRLLHAGSTGVGLLMLAGGIGSAIATPLSSRLVRRSNIGTPAALSLVLCGLPLALIAGIPFLDVALAFTAAWGVGMAVADVATSSFLNRLLETPALPRVTSAIEATKLGLEGLGALLAPVLIPSLGVRLTLVVAALPLPVVVLVGWRNLHRLDDSAKERSLLLETLHAVPCLEPLDMATLDSLIGRLTPANVPSAGTDIVTQGDSGDRFYVIESGDVDVLVDGFVVGSLGPGASFGERALLRDVPRTATVRSRELMQLLVLPRQDFLEALTGEEAGSVAWSVPARAHVDGRWDPGDLAGVLSRLNLFSHLASAEISDLAGNSKVERWAAGARIIRQGDEGDAYYVLLEGVASVLVDGQAVNEIHAGDQFGEIALLHRVRRTADVVARSPVITMSLHRDDFVPALRDRFLEG